MADPGCGSGGAAATDLIDEILELKQRVRKLRAALDEAALSPHPDKGRIALLRTSLADAEKERAHAEMKEREALVKQREEAWRKEQTEQNKILWEHAEKRYEDAERVYEKLLAPQPAGITGAEIVEIGEKFDRGFDAVAQYLIGGNPWSKPQSSSSSMRQQFQRSVIQLYGIGNGYCQVTACDYQPVNQIVTAHMMPARMAKRVEQLRIWGFRASDIWNPRNGLRMLSAAEKFFDEQRISFDIPDTSRPKELVLVVFDDRLRGSVVRASTPVFKLDHGRKIQLGGDDDAYPFMRALALHMRSAEDRATEDGWKDHYVDGSVPPETHLTDLYCGSDAGLEEDMRKSKAKNMGDFLNSQVALSSLLLTNT